MMFRLPKPPTRPPSPPTPYFDPRSVEHVEAMMDAAMRMIREHDEELWKWLEERDPPTP